MSLGFTLTLTLPEDQFFTRKYSTENREATGGKDRWESLGEMTTLWFYISFNILLFNQSNIVFMHPLLSVPPQKNVILVIDFFTRCSYSQYPTVLSLCSVCQVPVADGKSVQQTVDILHKKLEQLGAVKQGSFCVDCETYHSTGNVSGNI